MMVRSSNKEKESGNSSNRDETTCATVPMSARKDTTGESDLKKIHVFRGPENDKTHIDIKDIVIHIHRGFPQKKTSSIENSIVNPASIVNLARHLVKDSCEPNFLLSSTYEKLLSLQTDSEESIFDDEGNLPLFKRKEFSARDIPSSKHEEKEDDLPSKSKDKKKYKSSSYSDDKRTRKERSSRRQHSNSPSDKKFRKSSGGDRDHKHKDERDREWSKEKSDYKHSKHRNSSKSRDDRTRSDHRYSDKYDKYGREYSRSSERSRRRSRDRERSDDKDRYRRRSYTRSRSRSRTRSRGRYRSRSRSYERDYRHRSRSRSSPRPSLRHRPKPKYDKYASDKYAEEREYLKELRRRLKEREDRRLLKEENAKRLKGREEAKEEARKEVKAAENNCASTSHVPRIRPRMPRMPHPPFRYNMPYPQMYLSPIFRPPPLPFRPFPPYPPRRFFPPF